MEKLAADAFIHGILRPFAETLITPLLKRLNESIGTSQEKKLFQDRLISYTETNYQRLRTVTSVIFPEEGIELYKIYEPLTLQRKNSSRQYNVIVNKFPERLVSLGKVAISDAAGMGKSTILRYIYLKAVEEKKYIPVFIELRRLKKDKDVFHLLRQDLGISNSTITEKSLVELLKNGSFLILLDGFDEIQDENEGITVRLRECIDMLDGCKVIISSRPERIDSTLPEFRKFVIKPLVKQQAFSIIAKISNGSGVGVKLLSELTNPRPIDTLLEGFLSNPLLISLLFKSL